MSSHHIVREKQEPALLVLGLDDFSDELLGQLLEWSPTVITTPGTAQKLVAYGIKVDWIITDGNDEWLQPDVKRMPAADGNSTDAALEYLAQNGYAAVNIVTDKLDIDDYRHFANRINLVIFNGQQKIYPVISGFSKWKPRGEMVRLFSDVSNLVVKGLENINGQEYQMSADGFFSIYFDDPFLFIAEEV